MSYPQTDEDVKVIADILFLDYEKFFKTIKVWFLAENCNGLLTSGFAQIFDIISRTLLSIQEKTISLFPRQVKNLVKKLFLTKK